MTFKRVNLAKERTGRARRGRKALKRIQRPRGPMKETVALGRVTALKYRRQELDPVCCFACASKARGKQGNESLMLCPSMYLDVNSNEGVEAPEGTHAETCDPRKGYGIQREKLTHAGPFVFHGIPRRD